ncbi:MAG: OsmC family protein [Alphaproteobacteria bacterium]
MKHFIYVIIMSAICIVGNLNYVQAEENKNLYHINVTSYEVKNRIVESKVRNHTVRIDQPKEFGADDTAPTPPEYLAIAFGSCVVSTLRFIAILENIEIKNIQVDVSGTIDFSKAMEMPTEKRAGIEGLNVDVSFDSNLSKAEKQSLLDKALNRGAAIDNVMNNTKVIYKLVD